MCNPPFYASEAEIAELAAGKKFAPHAVRSFFPTAPILPVLTRLTSTVAPFVST